MATLVLDPFTLGMSPAPDGAVFQIKDIEGFPGLNLMLPIGTDTLATIITHGEKILAERNANKPKTVHVATPQDLQNLGPHGH